LQVSANGVISFNDPFTSVIPLPFPLSSDAELIVPYWAHSDITSAGTVFYRETNDSFILANVNGLVRAFSEFSSFSAITAFIVTWEGIGYNLGGADRVRFVCGVQFIQYTDAS